MSRPRYSANWELFLARMRMFYREPEAMFWTYGFPILLTIGLGIAFRSKAPEQLPVAVEGSPALDSVQSALESDAAFQVRRGSAAECEGWIRRGEVDVAVLASDPIEYRFDPTRPEAAIARFRVHETIQRAAGRTDVVAIQESHVTAPGARYIDFLIPGLLGMNLMGGGLWGIGFVTVDMRIRKLLKRMAATPMKKRDFFFSLIASRMAFTVPEVVLLMLTGWLLFGTVIEGSWLSIGVVCTVGALSFAGIGLMCASRARKIETISGLMNAVMLPMWIFSGIFFSAKRFPDVIQPLIQALPLTQLINALRAVITDGASLASQWIPLLILSVYGVVCFALALRWFRWT
jgi:ABC-type multidrug transport system permease subunit